MRLRSGILLLFLGICFASRSGQPQSLVADKDLAQGKRLYQEHCSLCHGGRGDDGPAANLAVPKLPHAPDDESLARLITEGFEGTDMPPAYGVTDSEVQQLVAYVRSLGRAAGQNVPGNASRGEKLYRAKGNCAQCHMLQGQGGRQGPDLSDIGVRRGPAHLRASVVDPEAALPHQFLLVQVHTKDDRTITGVRLNEDSFSIQVRDQDDIVHSFWKRELAELRKDFGKSSMPSYRGVFTEAELDDLVALLVSLRGDR